MTDEANAIAGSILALRCRNRLTQLEVSEAMGVTQATVSNWERTGAIKLADAVRLSDYYGVPLCEIAGRVEVREAIPRVAPARAR